MVDKDRERINELRTVLRHAVEGFTALAPEVADELRRAQRGHEISAYDQEVGERASALVDRLFAGLTQIANWRQPLLEEADELWQERQRRRPVIAHPFWSEA